MKAEEIIKKHAPDWNNWHEQCREQVLAAMEEHSRLIALEFENAALYSNSHNLTRFQLRGKLKFIRNKHNLWQN